MKVDEFEKRVLEVEEVIIRVRCGTNTEIGNFEYQRQAGGGTSVSDWLETRIKPLLDDHEVSVIDGGYARPQGRTLMRTLRDSYER